MSAKTDSKPVGPQIWIEMLDPGPGNGKPGHHCRLIASTEKALEAIIKSKLVRGWKICTSCEQKE